MNPRKRSWFADKRTNSVLVFCVKQKEALNHQSFFYADGGT